jgi:hypothetical protein
LVSNTKSNNVGNDLKPLNRTYSTEHQKKVFTDNFVGTNSIEYGKETLIAIYKSTQITDAQDVEVYCYPRNWPEIRMPEDFYTLKIISVSKNKKDIFIKTGCGESEWIALTAKKISNGMIVSCLN